MRHLYLAVAPKIRLVDSRERLRTLIALAKPEVSKTVLFRPAAETRDLIAPKGRWARRIYWLKEVVKWWNRGEQVEAMRRKIQEVLRRIRRRRSA